MVPYIAGRMARAVFVMWAAFTVSFLLLYALPSDPVSLAVGPNADLSPQELAQRRAQYGFSQPLVEQYLRSLASAAHGDLGRSLQTGQTVTSELGAALGPTVQIACAGLALAVVLGTLLAFTATLTRRRWLQQALLALPPIGVALPSFLIGLLLIQQFSFHWHLLPSIGDSSWQAAVLPSVTLAIPAAALLAQVLAQSLQRTLREDYIETALAKGMRRTRIHARDALRNAALPALTMAGLLVGSLLSGTVIVETVFSRPGLGRLTTTAVSNQDLPTVRGLALLGALVFVAVNLIVDALYPLLDPRVGRARGRRRLRRPARRAVREA